MTHIVIRNKKMAPYEARASNSANRSNDSDDNNSDDDDSDAEYADVDANLDNQREKNLAQTRESIVFLIDCSPEMMQKTSKNFDDNERSYLSIALSAARNVMRQRVIQSPDDEIGIVLYNTRKKNERQELDVDKVYVMQELAVIDAKGIQKISEIVDSGDFGKQLFEAMVGTGELGAENSLTKGLWAAQQSMQRNSKMSRSVFVFTNDDVVVGGVGGKSDGSSEKEKKKWKEVTMNRCEEMANAGIKLELFPGPKSDERGEEILFEDDEGANKTEWVFRKFDITKGSIWRDILKKFRQVRKKRENDELQRRRKVVLASITGVDEDIKNMLREEEENEKKRKRILRKEFLNNEHQRGNVSIESDEEEALEVVISNKSRVENLEVVARRKITRRRARKIKVWFNDGNFALPFTVMSLIAKAKKPAPKYIDGEDHQDLRTETVYADKDTAEVIVPKYLCANIGPEQLEIIVKKTENQATYAASKNYTANSCKLGLHCLGFVDTKEVTEHCIGQGKFIRPDEGVFGGKEAFSALLTACAERNVSMLCADVYNAKSQVKYVALVPQAENNEHLGVPAGFHLVKLPYRDDIREPQKLLPAKQASATETQIKAAEKLVEAMCFTEFHPNNIANPDLQAHYKALEAIALNKLVAEKAEDDTAPPIEQLWKPLGVIDYIENFSESVYGVRRVEYGDDYDHKITGRKRKEAEKPSAAVEIHEDFKEFATKALEGSLSLFTVDKLKTYLDAHGLTKSGSKAVLVLRIEKHARACTEIPE